MYQGVSRVPRRQSCTKGSDVYPGVLVYIGG